MLTCGGGKKGFLFPSSAEDDISWMLEMLEYMAKQEMAANGSAKRG